MSFATLLNFLCENFFETVIAVVLFFKNKHEHRNTVSTVKRYLKNGTMLKKPGSDDGIPEKSRGTLENRSDDYDAIGDAKEENDDTRIYVNHNYLPKIYKTDKINDSKIFKKEYSINGNSFSEESFVDRNNFKEFQIIEDDKKFYLESIDRNCMDKSIDESMDDFIKAISDSMDDDFIECVKDVFPGTPLDVSIQETQYGLIINSIVLVPENNWHSIVTEQNRTRCIVCDLSVDKPADHIKLRSHKRNLDTFKPLKKYECVLTRRIRDKYHCIICNAIIKFLNIRTHLDSKDHEENVLYSTNRAVDVLECNLRNDKDIDFTNCDANSKVIDTQDENVSNNDERNIWPKENSYASTVREPNNLNDNKSEMMALTEESWHMILIPNTSKFYCMACTCSYDLAYKKSHYLDEYHLKKLNECKFIDKYKQFFVRKVGERYYHCGMCNTLQYPYDIDNHMETAHHIIVSKTDQDEPQRYINNENQTNISGQTRNMYNANMHHESNENRSSSSIHLHESNENRSSPSILRTEYLYLNQFQQILRISYMSYHFVIRRIDDYICWLCNFSSNEFKMILHTGEQRHMGKMIYMYFLPDFGLNLIRVLNPVAHCAICDTYFDVMVIYEHIQHPLHIRLLTAAIIKSPNYMEYVPNQSHFNQLTFGLPMNYTINHVNESNANRTNANINELSVNQSYLGVNETSVNLTDTDLKESDKNLTYNDTNESSANLTNIYVKETSENLTEPALNESGENLTEPALNESGENLTDPELNESGEILIDPELNESDENRTDPELNESGENLIDPELNESGENLTDPELNESGENLIDPELNESGETLIDPELNESGETLIDPELNESGENLIDPELNESGEILIDPELNESGENLTDPELNESRENLIDPQLNESGENLTDPELNESRETLIDPELNESGENLTDPELNESRENLIDPELNESGENLIDSELNESGENLTDPELNESRETLIDPELNESGENLTDPELNESRENLIDPELNESGENLIDSELNESGENLTDPELNESRENLIDPELNESGENLTDPEFNESRETLIDPELNESGENLTDPELNESRENLIDPELNESGENLTDPDLNESRENLIDPELNESGENVTDPELNESSETLTNNNANESSTNQTKTYVKKSSKNLTDPEWNKSGENLTNNNANESSANQTKYDNPKNIDMKESGENQTIIIEPYIFDCIYLKVKDTYVKVSYKSYNGVTFIGDGSHYCFLCSLRLYDSYQEHIENENHLVHLKNSYFIDRNIKHLLRQSSTAYHCVNCNIIFIKRELESHMKWEGLHLKCDKKTRKSDFKLGIKRVDIKTTKESSMLDVPSEMSIVIRIDVRKSRGDVEVIKSEKVVVFGSKCVKISWDSWHGLTKNKKGYHCALCQINLKENVVNMHIGEEKHATILQNSIEKKFLPSIIRTINESNLHCLTCNVAVLNRNNVFFEHLKGKKHDRNLFVIKKIDLNNVSHGDIIYA